MFEARFPIRVLSYSLRTDSGGPGKFRGGLATQRTIRIEAPEIRVSMLMDHTKSGPWAPAGGSSGALAGVSVKRSRQGQFQPFIEAFGTSSPSKFADVRLHQGDEVEIRSCGGAGYGDPLERARHVIVRDLAEGSISPAAAMRIYGATDLTAEGRPDS